MINPAMFFSQTGINYLAGNAQVFDGSFNYNDVLGWTALNRADTFSILFALDIYTKTNNDIFSQGNLTNSRFSLQLTANTIIVRMLRTPASDEINITYPYTAVGKDVLLLTYDGSSTAAGFAMHAGGQVLSPTVIYDTLTTNLASNSLRIGARMATPANFFAGKMKQAEVVNFAANATQIEKASASGSFRGAGIAHDSGQYLLAIDFDKADGENPTTFADTPFYAITGFGGTTYETYL